MPVDNKKEKEREEVHRAIWAIADELRGAVDGWDFKNYVLVTIFYRYISENLTAWINKDEWESGNTDFDYVNISDEEAEDDFSGLFDDFVHWDDEPFELIVSNLQLPSNLFFGTSIATCILVMKKGKTDNRILFIDATNECIKVTNNNKLTSDNINHIVQAYTNREDIEYMCRLVAYDEVKDENYNLSVSTYVEQKDTREKVDIIMLNAEIKEIVAREQVLRDEIDKIIAEIEGGQEG